MQKHTIDSRMAGLPPWLVSDTSTKVAEYQNLTRLKWYCTCKDTISSVTFNHGKRKPQDAEIAAFFLGLKKVQEGHPQ